MAGKQQLPFSIRSRKFGRAAFEIDRHQDGLFGRATQVSQTARRASREYSRREQCRLGFTQDQQVFGEMKTGSAGRPAGQARCGAGNPDLPSARGVPWKSRPERHDPTAWGSGSHPALCKWASISAGRIEDLAAAQGDIAHANFFAIVHEGCAAQGQQPMPWQSWPGCPPSPLE